MTISERKLLPALNPDTKKRDRRRGRTKGGWKLGTRKGGGPIDDGLLAKLIQGGVEVVGTARRGTRGAKRRRRRQRDGGWSRGTCDSKR